MLELTKILIVHIPINTGAYANLTTGFNDLVTLVHKEYQIHVTYNACQSFCDFCGFGVLSFKLLGLA